MKNKLNFLTIPVYNLYTNSTRQNSTVLPVKWEGKCVLFLFFHNKLPPLVSNYNLLLLAILVQLTKQTCTIIRII